MRNIKFYMLLLIVSVICSCSNTEEILFEGPYHARFTETSSTIIENYSDPFNQNYNEEQTIELHLASPKLNNTTIILFDTKGTAVENEDYVILNSSKRVLISAGQFFGEIKYLPINNREKTGDKTIIFEITEVNNDLEIGFGPTGSLGKTHTVTIADDDCYFDVRDFEGSWEFNQNKDEYIYNVDIEVDWDYNNRIIIRGFTGLSEEIPAFVNLDLCNQEFIIPEQQIYSGVYTRTEEKGTFNFGEKSKIMEFSYSFDDTGSTIHHIKAKKLEE